MLTLILLAISMDYVWCSQWHQTQGNPKLQTVIDKQGTMDTRRLKEIYNLNQSHGDLEERLLVLKAHMKTLEHALEHMKRPHSKPQNITKVFHLKPSNHDSVKQNIVVKKKWMSSRRQHIYFNLSFSQDLNKLSNASEISAILRLFKKSSTLSQSKSNRRHMVDRARIKLFYIKVNDKTERRRFSKKLLHSRVRKLQHSEWLDFNVTDIVRRWLNEPSSNHGFLVSVKKDLNIKDIINLENSDGVNFDRTFSLSPRLDLTVTQTIQQSDIFSEQKMDCTESDGENRCCRYPIWVSFKDIGWDSWILAPEGYQAYYCDGYCPNRYKLANLFAAIKFQLPPVGSSPKPTVRCSPTKFTSLPIVHFNSDGHVVVSIFDDMIVKECGCV